jgi:hypothetical protein
MQHKDNFEYFMYLPEEIQTEIFSKDRKLLKQTRQISKLVSSSSKFKYFELICLAPIDKEEIMNYLRKSSNNMYVFIWENVDVETYENIVQDIDDYKFADANVKILGITPLRQNMYRVETRYIFSSNRMVHATKAGDEIPHYVNINGIANLMETYDFDLLSKLNIYYNRGCDEDMPELSKNKILQELKFNYNEFDKLDFFSITVLHYYLVVHSFQFVIPITQSESYDKYTDINEAYQFKIINSDPLNSNMYLADKNSLNLVNKDIYLRLRKFIKSMP